MDICRKVIIFNFPTTYKMNQPEQLFQSTTDRLVALDSDVHAGKMMSSPGLKYRDKVFAFFYKNEMGFRLGPTFDPDKMGISNAKPLNPFKRKPPLKGWFIIEHDEIDTWETLSKMALEFTKSIK